jgi:hypothetical protein
MQLGTAFHRARIFVPLPTPPDYRLVPQCGHFAYLTPCNEILSRNAAEICFDLEGSDRAALLRRFHRSVISFYRQRLK